MDRVHDYESCDIGSIPIMSIFARIVQWIEHGSSKAMILVRFQVWVLIFGVITLTGKGVVLKTTSNRSDTAWGFESLSLRFMSE